MMECCQLISHIMPLSIEGPPRRMDEMIRHADGAVRQVCTSLGPGTKYKGHLGFWELQFDECTYRISGLPQHTRGRRRRPTRTVLIRVRVLVQYESYNIYLRICTYCTTINTSIFLRHLIMLAAASSQGYAVRLAANLNRWEIFASRRSTATVFWLCPSLSFAFDQAQSKAPGVQPVNC